MITKLVATVTAAAFLLAGPAWSLTIANEDADEREVTLSHAGTDHKLKIGAGDSATVDQEFCAEGCSVAGPNGEAVMSQIGDSLFVKDGEVLKTQAE
ncbi:hypothetical protein [Hyphomicrobium sp. CS1GBMeth3]|uniref:hypothetical protein n=1 Tax=Hyphomicrobium sp. CS1GBMeth3 TaxID=1892845 RepID=UPI0009301DE1|nr:hypothetical protein [Hyphomicrobium sp. CS1GBMeth3]